MTANPYETTNRLKRVQRLLVPLLRAGTTAEQAEGFDLDFWKRIADAVGITMPSDKTRKAVIDALRGDGTLANAGATVTHTQPASVRQ